MFLATATVMKDFANWCQAMRVDFDQNLDAFRSENSIEPMIFLCLYHRAFALGLRISDQKPNSLGTVMKHLVETLICDGNTALVRFLVEMGEKVRTNDTDKSFVFVSENEYSRLAMHFVVAVSEKVGGKKQLAQFITANVRGDAVRVHLLIKFKFLKEARAVCDDPKLLEVIYAAAVEAGDREVMKQCRRPHAR
jgi:hypothetical protein